MNKVIKLTAWAMLALFAATGAQAQRRNKSAIEAEAAAQAMQQRIDSIKAIITQANAGNDSAQVVVGEWCMKGENGVEQNYKTALQWFAKAAQSGNGEGIANMAYCYQKGLGTDADSTSAMKLYQRAFVAGAPKALEFHAAEAAKGSVFSSILLGEAYSNSSWGVKRNTKQAIEYLRYGAEAGNVNAQRQVGMLLLNSRESREASEWFKKAAAQNDLTSTYWYGKMLLDGNGMLQNAEHAVIYLRAAADRNFPTALLQIGNCYQNGTGLKKDADSACVYFSKAAELGNIHAHWNLGLAKKDGNGTTQSYELALNHLAKAVNDGYRTRFKNLCDATKDENWTDTPFMTYLQARKAYEDGDFDKTLELAKILQKAKNVEGDKLTAMVLQNSEYAKNNPKKAFKAMQKAAKTDILAKCYLADYYTKGIGVNADEAKAQELQDEVAEAGIDTGNLLTSEGLKATLELVP